MKWISMCTREKRRTKSCENEPENRHAGCHRWAAEMQPIGFELAFNIETARQVGITILQSVLYRADKVIK